MTSYSDFLENKKLLDRPSGMDCEQLNSNLFKFQHDIVRWALKRGRAALFEDCGLGKTLQQLAWCDEITKAEGGKALVLTPLAVAQQTVRDGSKFGIDSHYCRSQADVKERITVANYDMLEHFDASQFIAVVLDESSILKSFMGKTKRMLLDMFCKTPYRLACTATPSPNDHMELGNHAEFLGIMPSNEMLSRWFINDTTRVGHYRLKGHAENDFWEWVASWAVCISKPSDIGYNDDGFDLPELIINEMVIQTNHPELMEEDSFLPKPSLNATDIHKVMRITSKERAKAASTIARSCEGPFILWCNTDYEAEDLKREMPEAVEVRGSDPIESKCEKLAGFSSGDYRVIITKPRIAGFGLNWQHCADMAFVGLSYSYEQLYQAIRRSYRFGQQRNVHVSVIVADTEVGVLESIRSKQADHVKMQTAMIGAMRTAEMKNVNPAQGKVLRVNDRLSAIKIPSWAVQYA